jgi:hypothetical protein
MAGDAYISVFNKRRVNLVSEIFEVPKCAGENKNNAIVLFLALTFG